MHKETKTEKDICTPVFIAALFTITRTWKPPRGPSAEEWINVHMPNGILLGHEKEHI